MSSSDALSKNDLWFTRALATVPGGVHSNSRQRLPHPSYFEAASGHELTDVDGRRITDLVMGNGAVMLGYRDPDVTRALQAALETGLGAGVESPLSVRAAESVAAVLPKGMQVRFANTGTEAAMHLAHMARATTGRNSLAKVEGSYHGWYDPLNVSFVPGPRVAGPPEAPVSVPGSGGDDSRWAGDTLVLPHNEPDAAEALLRANKDRIAAVFVEPILVDVGFIPCTSQYLERLRTVTSELSMMLVFDELLTGMRIEPGTVGQALGIRPDAVMLGKAIANGMPVAALASDPAWFEVALPGGKSSFVGTFNGHALSLAAVVATLEKLQDGTIRRRLEDATAMLAGAFDEAARTCGVPAHLQGGGGHFQWYFRDEPVRSYRQLWECAGPSTVALTDALTTMGYATAPGVTAHQAISLSHLGEPVERLAKGFRTAMEHVVRA